MNSIDFVCVYLSVLYCSIAVKRHTMTKVTPIFKKKKSLNGGLVYSFRDFIHDHHGSKLTGVVLKL